MVGAFEVLAPLCLFSRRFRLAWIPIMVTFHLGTWVLMGIFFLFNLLMIPMFVTDVDRRLARPRAAPGKAS